MKKEITAESFLPAGDKLVPIADLSPALREDLACWLKETYLNELCRGRAIFAPAGASGQKPIDGKNP